jgi:hypothetical protein
VFSHRAEKETRLSAVEWADRQFRSGLGKSSSTAPRFNLEITAKVSEVCQLIAMRVAAKFEVGFRIQGRDNALLG